MESNNENTKYSRYADKISAGIKEGIISTLANNRNINMYVVIVVFCDANYKGFLKVKVYFFNIDYLFCKM